MLRICIMTICALIFAMIIGWNTSYFKIGQEKNYQLVTVVLSARQNFEQRDIIRSTWGQEKPENVGMYFVVGSHHCPFPPEACTDSFVCNRLQINIPEVQEKVFTTHKTLDYFSSKHKVPLYSGFVFTVHHEIRIKKVGVLVSAILNKKSFQIEIVQGSTNQKIANTLINFTDNSSHTEVDGYVYYEIEEFVYPRGFEGIVTVNSMNIPNACNKTVFQTSGGVISYKAFYSNRASGETFYYELENGATAASFQFVIHNLTSLYERMRNMELHQQKWAMLQSNISTSLDHEQSKWKDIVFVDCVDDYRSLPQKLLLFYNWLTVNSGINYRFLLKTDDDTVLNLKAVLNKLHLLKQHNIWWGRFRRNWIVNRFGKWSDNAYTSSVYPAFACGAGYVLSKDIIEWIARNYQRLHQYQGEDISLAIWLSAIHPSIIEDDFWSCDASCVEQSYNRAQLTLSEMKETWNLYQKCGNICHCNEDIHK